MDILYSNLHNDNITLVYNRLYKILTLVYTLNLHNDNITLAYNRLYKILTLVYNCLAKSFIFSIILLGSDLSSPNRSCIFA